MASLVLIRGDPSRLAQIVDGAESGRPVDVQRGVAASFTERGAATFTHHPSPIPQPGDTR